MNFSMRVVEAVRSLVQTEYMPGACMRACRHFFYRCHNISRASALI